MHELTKRIGRGIGKQGTAILITGHSNGNYDDLPTREEWEEMLKRNRRTESEIIRDIMEDVKKAELIEKERRELSPEEFEIKEEKRRAWRNYEAGGYIDSPKECYIYTMEDELNDIRK